MASTNTFGGRRILVVEDDYLLVMDLLHALRANGAEVVGPLDDVDDALEALDGEGPIDGALLDVSVQGESVFPLADELEERGIPFVFVTGYDASIIPERFAGRITVSKPADVYTIMQSLAAPDRHPSSSRSPH